MRHGGHRKKISLMNNFLTRYAIKHHWIADNIRVNRNTFEGWIKRYKFDAQDAKEVETLILNSGRKLKKFQFKNEDLKAEFNYCLENFGIKRHYFADYIGVSHEVIRDKTRGNSVVTDSDIATFNQALQEQVNARCHFTFPIESIRQTDVETEQLSA